MMDTCLNINSHNKKIYKINIKYSLRDVFLDYFIDLFSMIVKSLNSNKIKDNLTRTD